MKADVPLGQSGQPCICARQQHTTTMTFIQNKGLTDTGGKKLPYSFRFSIS